MAFTTDVHCVLIEIRISTRVQNSFSSPLPNRTQWAKISNFHEMKKLKGYVLVRFCTLLYLFCTFLYFLYLFVLYLFVLFLCVIVLFCTFFFLFFYLFIPFCTFLYFYSPNLYFLKLTSPNSSNFKFLFRSTRISKVCLASPSNFGHLYDILL